MNEMVALVIVAVAGISIGSNCKPFIWTSECPKCSLSSNNFNLDEPEFGMPVDMPPSLISPAVLKQDNDFEVSRQPGAHVVLRASLTWPSCGFW